MQENTVTQKKIHEYTVTLRNTKVAFVWVLD